ncbi:glutamyl-tRNA synthetase [Aspergillus minisclerotigenes]|uniref:Glutamyl-tRNA synthetase n=1 Tax=Aspergillus minisclerotigenes TaxID=656917 RepID=A0A5N6JHX6_9EURO|nr:glutamyl-tRNA synthetase [Aspergillus minisclerotigenes]
MSARLLRCHLASNANAALTLPAILAAAYVTHQGGEVDITYEEGDHLGSDKDAVELATDTGDRVIGDAIFTYLQDVAHPPPPPPQNVDEWLERSTALTVADFKALDKPMKELESHLTLRSYIVSYSLTLADVALWGILRSNRVIVGLRRNSININRWFSFVESTNPWMAEAVSAFNSRAQPKKAPGANYNIGLKNTENGIACRFPPEPSGYLHIGHAKAALLNSYFAHEYGNKRGTLICRFDDTNPSKESEEFRESILHDLSLLGVIPDRITYSSYYFQEMYEACIGLIKSGKAYADNTVKEIMQDQRMKGIASACRDMSPGESLAHIEEMKSGSEEGLQWCIRAKISVDDTNKALGDPVIYRCLNEPHHRTGSTWKIYPTYDFCVPFLDSIEQVTHALRTNEYRDRNPQYHWMQEALNFVRTVLSKLWGWDDPRMPTVRGIRRRGCTIPVLREFILKQGPSQNIVNMDWTRFWAINKKYIDPVAARYTAIPSFNAVTALIDGVEATTSAEMPKHKNPSLGTKKVIFGKEIIISQDDAQHFKENERFTLMNWGNAIVSRIITDLATGKVLSLNLKLAKDSSNMVSIKLYTFDYLISKDKKEKHEDFASFFTKPSEFCTEAWADCNVAQLSLDDIIQFDRTGYFRVDQAYRDGQPAVMFNIPTGKGA